MEVLTLQGYYKTSMSQYVILVYMFIYSVSDIYWTLSKCFFFSWKEIMVNALKIILKAGLKGLNQELCSDESYKCLKGTSLN